MRARRRIHELMLLAIAACTLTAALGGCSLFLDHEAVIDVDVVEGVVPLTIRFDGCRSTGSSGIESYRWRFGNGDESFDASGTYTYLHAGSFPLTLTVRGFDGETRTTSVQIEVKACIWLADASLGKVYKLGLDGQLVTEFDAPAASPHGVAIVESGGAWRLYVACQGGGFPGIYRIDPGTGTVVSELPAPAQAPLSLAYGGDAPRRVWHVDGTSRKIYELNPGDLLVLGSFGSSYFYATGQVAEIGLLRAPAGLAWTREEPTPGVLWYLEGSTQLLYRIRIVPPSSILGGLQLTVDGEGVPLDPSVFPVTGMDWYEGYLWVVDADHAQVVQIDPATGRKTGVAVVELPGANAAGLTFQK